MKPEQYIATNNMIQSKLNQSLFELNKAYMKGNLRFKIGNVIENNNMDRIVITKFLYIRPKVFGNPENYPLNVYRGYVLTKKGNIRKDKETRSFPDNESNNLKLIKECQ